MLALIKYGDRAASTRQRLFQYIDYLASEGIEVEASPILGNDYLDRLYSGAPTPIFSVLQAYLRRVKLLTDVSRFDLIWVQYESFPYFPGFVEKLTMSRGKPIVYDFDDAIFHQYDSNPNAIIRCLLGRKLEPVIRGASLCLCGNNYLKAYADRFASHTTILPTVLDTTVFFPSTRPRDPTRPITLGWIGSPSTWSYVEPLTPLLGRVSEELSLTVRVVGAGRADLTHHRFDFVDWSEDKEVSLIQEMDIGIMPLPDEPWARGKCGYKLIQYMACGLPVIASPVGVNSNIVDQGVNGFLARDEAEWERAIRRLAVDAGIRAEMGAHGRQKIIDEYSLQVHGPRLAAMLRSIADACSS